MAEASSKQRLSASLMRLALIQIEQTQTGIVFHGSSGFTTIHQMINLPEFTSGEITK